MHPVREEWRSIPVERGEMRVYVARPVGVDGPVPAMIVIQEIMGVNDHIRDVTRRYAALGYVAAAPEMFHRTGPGFESGYDDLGPGMKHAQAMKEEGMIADLKATFDMLAGDQHVLRGKIGAVGFCMGGRAAFLANATLPLACAISYYGGRLPPAAQARAKDVHGPQLFFWGAKDKHIGPEQQRATVDALREAKKPYVDVEFGAADHGFFCDQRGSYEPMAAKQSWALAKEFLALHLGGT